MSTSREVNNLLRETMAGINSSFAVVTEEILQMLTFLECAVLSSSLYVLIQLFSLIRRRIVAFRIFTTMLFAG